MIGRRRPRAPEWLTENGIVAWAVVAVLVVVTSIQAGGFATPENISNLGRQLVALALVSLAQYVIVLTGGADLSLAANVKITSILAAISMDGQDSMFGGGVLIALGVGLTIGVLNALVIILFRVEPFIATLGVGVVVAGVSLYIASTPQGRSAPLLDNFYRAQLPGGIYLVTLVAVFVWLGVWLWLSHTRSGRHVYAVGGARDVAELSGIRVNSVTGLAYVVGGLLGGVAGLVTLAGSGVGDPNAANGLEFISLAVVIIGGASLAGGRGRLTGLLAGVVLFGILGNIFNLLRVEVWYQELLRGVIILVAAALIVNRVRLMGRRHSGAAEPKSSN